MIPPPSKRFRESTSREETTAEASKKKNEERQHVDLCEPLREAKSIGDESETPRLGKSAANKRFEDEFGEKFYRLSADRAQCSACKKVLSTKGNSYKGLREHKCRALTKNESDKVQQIAAMESIARKAFNDRTTELILEM
ncbi:hypothetical protein FOL47_002484, partial [Perkinsus chesapeaki]